MGRHWRNAASLAVHLLLGSDLCVIVFELIQLLSAVFVVWCAFIRFVFRCWLKQLFCFEIRVRSVRYIHSCRILTCTCVVMDFSRLSLYCPYPMAFQWASRRFLKLLTEVASARCWGRLFRELMTVWLKTFFLRLRRDLLKDSLRLCPRRPCEWPYLTTAHDLLSLYNAHRAVIFAIAQLSCLALSCKVKFCRNFAQFVEFGRQPRVNEWR